MLDPRSSEAARRGPILDSVNIPFSELPDRTYELPSRNEVVRIAHVGKESHEAVELLATLERKSRLVPAQFGEQEGPGRLWSPNPFLEEIAPSLTPGSALDLACGAGREAIYLASLGWRVLAIDLLPDSLERAALLASRYTDLAQRLEWRVVDLEREFPVVEDLDLVTMFYFLDRPALAEAKARLAPGGSIVLETFTEMHRERFGKPRTAGRVLGSGEAEALMNGLKVERVSEGWRPNGRHTSRVWARRPS
jgi:SAM-dependent methyltransferase